MQKFSSFGRKKKKQTKIRHRMVMLEGLQLLSNTRVNAGGKYGCTSGPKRVLS